MKIIRRALSALLASLLLVAAFFAPASAATIQAGYSASLLARQEGTGALFSYGGGSSGYLYGGQVGHGWGGFDYGFQIDSLNGSTYGDVIVRSPDGLLRIYHSDGEHLRGGYEIGHGWQAMSAMVPVSDWDGDGLPDILARTDDGRLKLYPTRGAGRWGHVREVGHGWNTMDFIVSPR